MDTKAAFEKWLISTGEYAESQNGIYLSPIANISWDAWQASRAAIEIELPEHCNGISSEAAAYDDALDECIEGITYHGIRIKGKE
jgi:hypothetical protein